MLLESRWCQLWLLVSAQLLVGCSGSNGSGGATGFRTDAKFAYVMYLDGPCDAATSVDIDLDTSSVRVGVGPTEAQSVAKSTLTAEELSQGRQLFLDDKIAVYRQASLPAGASQTPTGGSSPTEEAEGAGGNNDGTGPSDMPGTAPSTCNRDEQSPIGVTIFLPPGMAKKAMLRFAKTDTPEQPVSEMLEYFSELAARYHP